MDRKHLALSGAVLGVAIYLTFLWQPGRQVRLHQLHFLHTVEKRDWVRFSNFIADNYSDRWQHDKNYLLTEPNGLFRYFLTLSIQAEELGLERGTGTASIRERLKMEGTGSPIAQLIIQRVNALSEPFVFQWKKQGWKPWDWKLMQIDQPELDLTETPDI